MPVHFCGVSLFQQYQSVLGKENLKGGSLARFSADGNTKIHFLAQCFAQIQPDTRRFSEAATIYTGEPFFKNSLLVLRSNPDALICN